MLPVCIRRDDDLAHQLAEAAEQFWKSVEDNEPPEKDPTLDVYVPQSLSEQEQWHKLTAVYRQQQEKLDSLKVELDHRKSQQKQLQQQLQQWMGDFRVAEFNGLRICQSDCHGSVDYQRALEALCQQHELNLPDLERFRRKSRHQVKVTVLNHSNPTIEPVNDSWRVSNPAIGRQSFYF